MAERREGYGEWVFYAVPLSVAVLVIGLAWLGMKVGG